MPKNVKGGPLGYNNVHSVAKYQKNLKGDRFESLKIFEKSRTVPKKLKGGPFSLVRVCRLRLKSENEKGDPLD